VGAVLGVSGAAILLQLTWIKFVNHEIVGDKPRLLLGVLLMIMAVQFIVLGLLAEMLARTYHESQRKPVYVIRQILQATDRDVPADAPAAPR